jgi:hypothetical protein
MDDESRRWERDSAVVDANHVTWQYKLAMRRDLSKTSPTSVQ